MDGRHFDALTKALAATMASRRRALRLSAGGALGLSAIPRPGAVGAKNRKRKKLKRNEFGCVNVGKACRGKDSVCCSGICQGKKPKQGKKDTSRCVAHNVLDCPAGANSCDVGEVACGTTGLGDCFQTTGKASFCGDNGFTCSACTKDADCEPDFGSGAACVVCSGDCPPPGTACTAAVTQAGIDPTREGRERHHVAASCHTRRHRDVRADRANCHGGAFRRRFSVRRDD